MMRRDFSTLDRGPVDLLVVGGGIYGSWIAYDAALRGLRTALVERADWAAGTSSASSKLIHGGLRYLERLHIGLVRTSLRERRRLARLAPHRIRPLRFVIPVYSGDRVGRLRWKLGLTLYDLLAGRDQPVAGHTSVRKHELLSGFPFLRPEGLRGGFSYGDCAMDDARYTLEIVDGALAAGAAAVNRAEVSRLATDRGRVIGAEVRDRESGAALELRAALTVDCSGAWSAEVLPDRNAATELTRMTKGAHLVMPGLPVEEAFLLLAGVDGRVFFLIPWYGRTLLGTTDTPYHGDPDELRLAAGDIDYLLGAAGRYFRSRWTERDIQGGYVGLRVLQNERAADPSEVTREWALEEPAPGLLMPVGGKYTSARADAAQAVDVVMERLGRPRGGRPTEERAFPWTPPGPFATWLESSVARGIELGLDPLTAHTGACRHGARVGELFALIERDPGLAAPLHPELPFSRAEVVHAAAAEMARTLEDVLRRRVPVSLLARLDPRVVGDAATLADRVLGWSEDERRRQVETLLAELRLPEGPAP